VEALHIERGAREQADIAMKAVVFDRTGGPEVLELRDRPDPTPAADEVVIDVKACGMNHLDLWIRSGAVQLEIEMPHVLGCDVVGVAREVGAAVRHVKPGDKVLVLPTLSCGVCAPCLAGDDNLCRHYDLIGRKRNGCYAERVVGERLHHFEQVRCADGAPRVVTRRLEARQTPFELQASRVGVTLEQRRGAEGDV